MKDKTISKERIHGILEEHAGGASLRSLAERHGIPEAELARWKHGHRELSTREVLAYVSGLQRTLVEVSRAFMQADLADIDTQITRALARIGEACAVDRAYLFRFKNGLAQMDNTHEWCAPGITPEIENLKDLPREAVPNVVRLMEQREVMRVPRVADLGAGWEADRAVFEEEDIQSLVVVPIVVGREVSGFIGFDSVRRERDWSDEEIQLLGVLGDLIGAVLKRLETEQRLLQMAHYDGLTGLPNRELAWDRLTQLLYVAQRRGEQLAVLFVDIDNFKKVNDTLGHETGDRLLMQAAQRLSGIVRRQDTVARLGGDEFLVLLSGIDREGRVQPVLEKILARFREPFEIDGYRLVLTASVGVALSPADGDTPQLLLRSADTAMYKAKAGGRNTFHFFTESMDREMGRRLEIETALRQALDRGELYPVFQPVLELATGRIVGAEALLRWDSESLGPVSPLEFIPVAEQTGLIEPLGDLVLEEALRQSRPWREMTGGRFQIAVNISPRQFRNPELVDNLGRAMQRHAVGRHNLVFEITEGVLFSEQPNVRQTLSALREIGVRIAMDDFGTGYSSLSYLREYPFDILKVDQRFIRNCPEDPRDAGLVVTALRMAEHLGLNAVAEGVETQAQRDFLHAEGCGFAQGYLFSRPVAAEQIAALLANPVAAG